MKNKLKLLSFVAILLYLTSCSTANKTHVKVLNKADSTETKITVTNGDGGSSSITVSPKVKLDSIRVL